jgi:hypothetical protein
MTNHQKIFILIQKQRIASLDAIQIESNLEPYVVLKALAKLVIARKLKAITKDGIRYFCIKDKKL